MLLIRSKTFQFKIHLKLSRSKKLNSALDFTIFVQFGFQRISSSLLFVKTYSSRNNLFQSNFKFPKNSIIFKICIPFKIAACFTAIMCTRTLGWERRMFPRRTTQLEQTEKALSYKISSILNIKKKSRNNKPTYKHKELPKDLNLLNMERKSLMIYFQSPILISFSHFT